MKLLIATDGSQFAHEAARFGHLVAQALASEIYLLGVAERTDRVVALREHLTYLNQELDPASELAQSVRHGQPVEEILSEIETIQADLLVVGIRGRRNVAELIVGDTTRRLARKTTIPMLAVHHAHSAIRNILVCTAGGEQATSDVELAARIAQGCGGSLTILHVMSQVSMKPGAGAEGLVRDTEWHRRHETSEGRHLNALATRAQSLGVDARAKIRHGLIVEEIEAEANLGNYDLVVVGAHQRQGVWRWLLADVTEKVLARVARPILIVP